MPNSNKARDSWLDFLRGLAIFLVIADHSAIATAERLGAAPGVVEALNDAANPFRMATLIFVSGMLLPRSLQKPKGQYLWGKIANIAWPYLFWSCAILGVYAAGYALQGSEPLEAGIFLRIFYSPPTMLWYLAYLFAFYVVTLWLNATVKALLIPASMLVSFLAAGDGSWQSMFYLFGFFLIGDLASRHRAKWEPLTRRPELTSLGAGFALLAAVASVVGVEVRYQPAWAVAVPGGIFAVVPLAKALAETRLGRVLAGEGSDSIVYYVTHGLVILILSEALVRGGMSNAWVVYCVCLVSALVVGWTALRFGHRSPALDATFRLPPLRVKASRIRRARP
ncbi:acyltransferase family protein [Arthrobacter sp. TMS2-4]